jgi:glycosyltransferase involved in cell wall biosynthesis
LFEYTIAEIPVLATQQPEYLIILNQYQNGIYVNPDEKGAYLNGFKSILANYPNYKEKAIAAKQEINWNAEKKKLVDLYLKIEANLKCA